MSEYLSIDCARYQEYVYEYVKFGALVDGGEVNKRRVDRCGHKVVSLIVGGEAAKPREFPHMVKPFKFNQTL